MLRLSNFVLCLFSLFIFQAIKQVKIIARLSLIRFLMLFVSILGHCGVVRLPANETADNRLFLFGLFKGNPFQFLEVVMRLCQRSNLCLQSVQMLQNEVFAAVKLV